MGLRVSQKLRSYSRPSLRIVRASPCVPVRSLTCSGPFRRSGVRSSHGRAGRRPRPRWRTSSGRGRRESTCCCDRAWSCRRSRVCSTTPGSSSPVHPHVVVHVAGMDHLIHRRVPVLVVRLGTLQLLSGVGVLPIVVSMFLEGHLCPIGKARIRIVVRGTQNAPRLAAEGVLVSWISIPTRLRSRSGARLSLCSSAGPWGPVHRRTRVPGGRRRRRSVPRCGA